MRNTGVSLVPTLRSRKLFAVAAAPYPEDIDVIELMELDQVHDSMTK